MPITALPTPPSRSDSSTFAARSDAFLGALPAFGTEANAVQVTVTTKETEAITSASTASASAATAASNAATAGTHAGSALVNANATAASTNAPLWVSGTTYSAGKLVYSSVTARTYRRVITGAGTTDPSADTTNWKLLGLDVDTYLPSIRPTLNLDFANSQTVDPRITFTRTSTATRVNNKGLIESVDANVPRIDYDPVTLACKGLLIEEARTNLLLNSTINGANLATQSVTVTAVAHTLSFYGTGTVTLSGTATGSLVGAGAYPARSVLTFTPTAGTLTLTVTGTVQFSNLEVGSFASSYIVTAGASATRTVDVVVMTGSNFSSWYRQDEGAFNVSCTPYATSYSSAGHIVSLSNNTTAEFVLIQRTSALVSSFAITDSSVAQMAVTGATMTTGSTSNLAIGYKLNDSIGAYDGSLTTADTACTMPTVTQMNLGSRYDSLRSMSGHIGYLRYYPVRLPNAQLQLLTSL